MAPYTITYRDGLGAIEKEERRWFDHDDHAIDEVGWSHHPHEIEVNQGDRLVARFPSIAGHWVGGAVRGERRTDR